MIKTSQNGNNTTCSYTSQKTQLKPPQRTPPFICPNYRLILIPKKSVVFLTNFRNILNTLSFTNSCNAHKLLYAVRYSRQQAQEQCQARYTSHSALPTTPMPLSPKHELVSTVSERTQLTPPHFICGHLSLQNMPRYSLEEQHMIKYGLDTCQRFDGKS
jgi:hypothetical protein